MSGSGLLRVRIRIVFMMNVCNMFVWVISFWWLVWFVMILVGSENKSYGIWFVVVMVVMVMEFCVKSVVS